MAWFISITFFCCCVVGCKSGTNPFTGASSFQSPGNRAVAKLPQYSSDIKELMVSPTVSNKTAADPSSKAVVRTASGKDSSKLKLATYQEVPDAGDLRVDLNPETDVADAAVGSDAKVGSDAEVGSDAIAGRDEEVGSLRASEDSEDSESGDSASSSASAAADMNSAPPSPATIGKLQLQEVIDSVQRAYPEIEIAIGEIETARGKVLASWGEFDSVFTGHSISQPLGFYQTYRNGIGLERPLYGGGSVYSTFRIGDGNFEPWYGERETNEGGEVKAGFSLPFLKDRNIDARRAKLLSADAMRREVGADVEARLLQFQRFATQAYWDWVTAGQAVEIQQRLFDIADLRIGQIQERIKAGDLAEISRLNNDQLAAKRAASLRKAVRSFEKTAFKLSMFYRDINGNPLLALMSEVPSGFPVSIPVTVEEIEADVAGAIAVRPEVAALKAAREATCIDARYAQNLMLPKLDMEGFAGQDLGGETSSLGDKTPFQLQLGIFAEVPIQRREGLGKLQSARGKLTQIDAKLQFVKDKIQAEIQDAASALNAAHDLIIQSKIAVNASKEALEAAKLRFEDGDIDLVVLNIFETSVADAELLLLESQFKYFLFRAIYETAKSGAAFQ
jgi:outer membrane protein TolC